MTNERIKEILLEIKPSETDFSVTQTGKQSKRVNGFYKPDVREIFIHNLNLKSDNMLIYTAIHEYAHHLAAEEKARQNPASDLCCGSKAHTQEFWAKFCALLEIAEKKGFYSVGWEKNPELKSLTEDIKTNYLEKNGELMKEFGQKLARAFDLCKEADVRYEDYIDRVLCLPRNAAKDIRKVSAADVNPAIGFENMKIVANVKKKDERAEVEKDFLSGGKSPSTIREMMKQKSANAKEQNPRTKLEKEKSRLEKTIAQLTRRLEFVEESLANL